SAGAPGSPWALRVLRRLSRLYNGPLIGSGAESRYAPPSTAAKPITTTATSAYSRALMLRFLKRFIVSPRVGGERHDPGGSAPGLVSVEAPAGLATQPAGLDVLDQQRARPVLRLPQPL